MPRYRASNLPRNLFFFSCSCGAFSTEYSWCRCAWILSCRILRPSSTCSERAGQLRLEEAERLVAPREQDGQRRLRRGVHALRDVPLWLQNRQPAHDHSSAPLRHTYRRPSASVTMKDSISTYVNQPTPSAWKSRSRAPHG